VKKCWGDEVIACTDKSKASEVRATTIKGALNPQSIAAAFKRKGKEKGKVTYTHRQHTKTEVREWRLFVGLPKVNGPFKLWQTTGFRV
jgi:hypothetical protein